MTLPADALLLPPFGRLASRKVISARAIRVLLLAVPGFALAILFHEGVTMSRNAGIAALFLATIYGIRTSRLTQMSLLPRFMILLYVLPFSSLGGFLFSDRWLWTISIRPLAVSQDAILMRQMIAVGLIGLLGLIAGIQAASFRRGSLEMRMPEVIGGTLTLGVFLVMTVAAVFFSWLSSPPETIFQAAYSTGQSGTVAGRLNFPGAFLLSYIILVALAIDIERDSRRRQRRQKIAFLTISVAYIVIVLQLLRGDRESSGLVAALTAIYLTSPSRAAGVTAAEAGRRRMRRLVLPGTLAGALYVMLGAVRNMFVAGAALLSPLQALQYGLTLSTWTAVLFTNLGTAWQYRHGAMVFKYGSTYFDYLMSLPPGFITKIFGYVRPTEAGGLALETLFLSSGGLHIAITPFKNFGAVGVFFILAIYGYFMGRIEINCSFGALRWRLLWGATFASGFLWFWYGEMPYIRGLMMTVCVYFAYRVALSVRLSRRHLGRLQ